MIDEFESIIYELFKPDEGKLSFSIFDPSKQFDDNNFKDEAYIAKALNAAFMICLAGKRHRDADRAESFIKRVAELSDGGSLANFYLSGRSLIHKEIESTCVKDPGFVKQIEGLCKWFSHPKNIHTPERTTEKIWSLFFPEGTDIYKTPQRRIERIEQLRKKRTVKITALNATPLTDPGRQLLFTSNILITVPEECMTPVDLPLSTDLKNRILQVTHEDQIYWYDHPIQIGVSPDRNEALYGLRGLDEAIEFERSRGNLPGDRVTCVLSVSVTHAGLQKIVKRYLNEEISRSNGFRNLKIYVFTEADTKSIIKDILVPAAKHYTEYENAREALNVFGVDGEYGRHYSFLKAISAFWNILIDPEIKATFKIDLDQIFPQKELVEQSKSSAFEHFSTPLWGARGVDSQGNPVELGMIAGALVNRRDISKSLFTPDVVFPERTSLLEEKIFFSTLTQALSTKAEMMTRYTTDELDGKRTCIQRIHVTGGTNGILVGALRKHRPFTPTFIGRAEDQAYILSALINPGEKLAICHKDGLIMRHDKDAFAHAAIKAGASGKLIGDYIRMLYFSEYARVISDDISKLKDIVDPFTGCFISRIPTTVVFLRFCLRAASFFDVGETEQGVEFVTEGARRIGNSLNFVGGANSLLKRTYLQERFGWDLYYDVLLSLEQGLRNGDLFALELREKAQDIIQRCLLTQYNA